MRGWGRLLGLVLVAGFPSVAFAGMPTAELSDLVRMRIETLSFFLIGWLLCAWIVKSLWNGHRALAPFLPAISYRRACGVLLCWSFFAVLLLTMISGARELLTPGAWEKVGSTYRLRQATIAQLAPPDARRQRLEKLRVALWSYAAGHQGNLPDSIESSDIAQEYWIADEASGATFIIVPSRKVHQGTGIAVVEPRISEGALHVLMTTGEIRQMTQQEIERSWKN